MKPFILLLILFLSSATIDGKMINSSPGATNFLATFEVQATTVDIQNQIQATLHLVFPQDYTFDIDLLETQLLSSEAQAFSPFTLISKKIVENSSPKIGIREVTLSFVLQPELIGTYPLTFFNIPFTSLVGGKQVTFKVASNVFEIQVTSPLNITSAQTTPISQFPTLSYIPPIEMNLENIKHLTIPSTHTESQNAQIPTSFFFWGLMIAIFLLGNAQTLAWLKNKLKTKTVTAQNLQINKQTTFQMLLQKEITKKTSPQFYLETVNAIKNSFEGFLPFNVHSATAEDFCTKLPLSNLDLAVRNEISKIFMTEEKVKFSDYYPSYEENLELKVIAKNIYSAIYITQSTTGAEPQKNIN